MEGQFSSEKSIFLGKWLLLCQIKGECGKTKLFVCLPTPTIGEASAGEGLRLQPAQQACFSANINNIDLGLVRPGRFLGEVVLQKYDNDSRWINACIFNKSGVAGAVLQTALSLTD